MPKLTKRAIRYGFTDGRTDPNYRKALLLEIYILIFSFTVLSVRQFVRNVIKKSVKRLLVKRDYSIFYQVTLLSKSIQYKTFLVLRSVGHATFIFFTILYHKLTFSYSWQYKSICLFVCLFTI